MERVAGVYLLVSAESFENYIAETCKYGVLEESRDHAIPGYDQINLSEFIADPKKASGIIAHEIFHTIDPALSGIELSVDSEILISEDTHSPPLFRLHSQLYKKRGLPKACSELLGLQNPRIPFQKSFQFEWH